MRMALSLAMCCSVTAELIIQLNLVCGEPRLLLEMGHQMCVPDFRLKPADIRQQGMKRHGVYGAIRELSIKRLLFFHELLSERDRLRLHGLENRLGLSRLLWGQCKRVSQIQHVPWTGIMIQFGRFGIPQPSAVQVVVDVLLRQGLNVASLLAHVRRVRVGRGGDGYDAHDDSKHEVLH